jgi:Tfp pilus assembly protein PilE
MGQQQLLLIVLGVIIVGVAVVVGIQMFTDSAETANVDQVSTELLQYAVAAQQYYAKPAAMSGGGKVFTGYTLSSDTTDNATYTLAVNAQSVVITGTCLTALKDDGTAAKVVITVQPKTVSTTVDD